MFKKTVSFILIILLLFSVISCAFQSPSQPSSTSELTNNYTALISQLEQKLAQLQSSYDTADEQAKKQIAELEKQLAELREQATSSALPTSFSGTASSPLSTAKSVFTYQIVDGTAIITGFVGNDENIIIPSMIDGFKVSGIAGNAFEDYGIKSVIISNGVEYIDWFAFYNCESLIAVTIPSSVSKIGYSAFAGASPSFTIYCHKNSFAENYAKSYGLSYAFI